MRAIALLVAAVSVVASRVPASEGAGRPRLVGVRAVAQAHVASNGQPVRRLLVSADLPRATFADLGAALCERARAHEDVVELVVVGAARAIDEVPWSAAACPGVRASFLAVPADRGLDVWAQDAVEFVDGAGCAIYRMGHWSRASVLTIARALGFDVVVDVPPLAGDDGGNLGGNWEALPDGTFLVGDSMPRPLVRWLRARQRTIVVPTRWLTVGHVDEVFSILPGGRVAYADPVLGLALLARTTQHEWSVVFARLRARIAHGEGDVRKARRAAGALARADGRARFADSYRHYLRAGASGETWRDFEPQRPVRDEIDAFVRGNVLASRDHISTGLTRLRAATPTLDPVAVPALFFALRTNGARDRFIAAVPSALNLLALDELIVTADPLLPGFAAHVGATFAQLGYRVRFVDALDVWARLGGVHCVVAAQRFASCPAATRNRAWRTNRSGGEASDASPQAGARRDRAARRPPPYAAVRGRESR